MVASADQENEGLNMNKLNNLKGVITFSLKSCRNGRTAHNLSAKQRRI